MRAVRPAPAAGARAAASPVETSRAVCARVCKGPIRRLISQAAPEKASSPLPMIKASTVSRVRLRGPATASGGSATARVQGLPATGTSACVAPPSAGAGGRRPSTSSVATAPAGRRARSGCSRPSGVRVHTSSAAGRPRSSATGQASTACGRPGCGPSAAVPTYRPRPASARASQGGAAAGAPPAAGGHSALPSACHNCSAPAALPPKRLSSSCKAAHSSASASALRTPGRPASSTSSRRVASSSASSPWAAPAASRRARSRAAAAACSVWSRSYPMAHKAAGSSVNSASKPTPARKDSAQRPRRLLMVILLPGARTARRARRPLSVQKAVCTIRASDS